jgi:hypothetical protein
MDIQFKLFGLKIDVHVSHKLNKETKIMSDETRCLYAGLIYNWETRSKRFITWTDVGEVAQTLQLGDQLYLLDVALEPPKTDTNIQRAWCSIIRHDNPKPLLPDQTLHSNILSRLDGMIASSMPDGTYGPEIGPLKSRIISYDDKKSITVFSVPGHHFKLTIEEITPEEDNVLVSDWSK